MKNDVHWVKFTQCTFLLQTIRRTSKKGPIFAASKNKQTHPGDPTNAQTRADQDAKAISIRPYVGVAGTAVIDSDVDLTGKGGLVVGADAQYMVNNWFGVSAGAEFLQGGWKHDDSSYDKAVKMGNVSLSIGYRF